MQDPYEIRIELRRAGRVIEDADFCTAALKMTDATEAFKELCEQAKERFEKMPAKKK